VKQWKPFEVFVVAVLTYEWHSRLTNTLHSNDNMNGAIFSSQKHG